MFPSQGREKPVALVARMQTGWGRAGSRQGQAMQGFAVGKGQLSFSLCATGVPEGQFMPGPRR